MKSIYLLVPALIVVAACSKTPPADAIPAPPVSAAKSVDVPPGAYALDRAHASLTFSVNHLGFSNYTAQFKTFDVQLQFDPMNLTASSVTATIDPRSLDLDSPPVGFVDELIGKNWFDSEQYPVMAFKSTKVDALSAQKVRVTGDFTFHGVTKPVVLDATFNGGYAGHPMDPHARIGFSAAGVLKRSDFGVSYGIPEPGSTMGVGDEVKFMIEAEFSGPPLPNAQSSMPASAPSPVSTEEKK